MSAYEIEVGNRTVGVQVAPGVSAPVMAEHGPAPVVVASVPSPGAPGNDGRSAYQLAVDGGFVGTQAQWLDSLKGADGATVDLSGYATKTYVDDGLDEKADATATTTALGARVPATRVISAGAGLTGGGDLSADRGVAVDFGTTAGTVCAGDDARLAGGGGGYEPPFVFLKPRQQHDYGNGLDGRVPAVQVNDGALGGCYVLGVNAGWSNVDVYLAWQQGNDTSGAVSWRVYLATPFVPGVRPMNAMVANMAVAVSPTGLAYNETLMASNVAVTPSVLMSGAVARYGADASDTYASNVAVLGLIIREHV